MILNSFLVGFNIISEKFWLLIIIEFFGFIKTGKESPGAVTENSYIIEKGPPPDSLGENISLLSC